MVRPTSRVTPCPCGKANIILGDFLCAECRRERNYVDDEREAIQLEDVPFAFNPGRLGR